MVEVILRCSEIDEGGMLIVNAGNSCDVTGGCFVLVVGLGGVKTTWNISSQIEGTVESKASPTLHENNSREIMSESGSFAKPGNG